MRECFKNIIYVKFCILNVNHSNRDGKIKNFIKHMWSISISKWMKVIGNVWVLMKPDLVLGYNRESDLSWPSRTSQQQNTDKTCPWLRMKVKEKNKKLWTADPTEATAMILTLIQGLTPTDFLLYETATVFSGCGWADCCQRSEVSRIKANVHICKGWQHRTRKEGIKPLVVSLILLNELHVS